jgi:uncharacterized membrane protein
MANSPKLRGTYDLLAIITLTAFLVICVVFISSNIPRIIVGLPFVLFFPGYTLIAALFPRKDSLAGVERLALSFGLSLAVVPLIGLFLNYAWQISLYPMLISIAGFVAAMCVLAYLRRRQLAPDQRFQLHITIRLPSLDKQSRLDRALTAVLVVAVVAAVVAAIVAVIYVGERPKPGDEFTEFYLLGSSGTAGGYPSDMKLGEEADVTVGIANHEGKDVTYQVRILMNGAELEVREGIVLRHDEKWENSIVFAPIEAGDNQKVEFRLYRDGKPEPYHELHLWINVIDATKW